MRTFLLTLALGAISLPGAFAQVNPKPQTLPGKTGVTPPSSTGIGRTYNQLNNQLNRGNISSSPNRMVNGTGSANRMVTGSPARTTGSASRMAPGSANRYRTGPSNVMQQPSGVHPKGK